jgi:hypothetical protein
MFRIYSEIYLVLNFHIFILSVLLFFIGYALAPTVYFKNIKLLTAYPFLIIKLMDKYFKFHWPAFKIFAVIFLLNTFSQLINLLSTWGMVTPFIFIIYLGINTGVIMYHSLQGHLYYLSLLNPVALFELPAAWISITLAIQFSLKNFFQVGYLPELSFLRYLLYFLLTVPPLLFLAGIIETYLIVQGRKISEK